MFKIFTATIAAFMLFATASFVDAASSRDRPAYSVGYDERLLESKLEVIRTRLEAQEEALKLKTLELDRRLEGLNELRSDVIKDRDQFVRKDIYDARVKIVDELVNRVTIIETRLFVWMSALAAFFVFLQVGAHLFVNTFITKKSGFYNGRFSDADLARIRDAWMKMKE
jgi:hypothetical protein